MPLRVLFLLARDPLASRTGRIAVLETGVTGLVGAGHDVTVAAIADGEPGDWLGRPLTRVAPPRLAGLPLSVLGHLARRHSLNEAVLDGGRVRRDVTRVVEWVRPDVIVGDGIRTWPFLAKTGLPTVLHLDDLLSDRYQSVAFQDGNDSVLGYYGERLPGAVRGMAERVASRALGLEGRLVHRREIAVARACTVPAMTSRTEARILQGRAGCPVVDLPMAVDARTPGTPSEVDAGSFAFLGVLHYGPNLAALRHLRDEILPAARARGLEVTVTAYGKGADDLQHEFPASAGVVLAGYVDDLGEALRRHRGFLSPLRSGAGVKTKVLDAMSVGLPVAATRLGVEGIPVTAGENALVGDTTDELVEHIRFLVEQPDRADQVGRAGWELLRTTLSAQRVRSAWDDAVRSAAQRGPAVHCSGSTPQPGA